MADEDTVGLMKKLIAAYNPNAVEANVCLMFRSKCSKRGGKLVLGKTKKESDRAKLLHGFDYIIELGADAWQELSNSQREALLLHEVLHISAVENGDGSMDYGIEQHDTEEFRKVIEAFGLWTPDLEELAKTIEERAKKEDAGETAIAVNEEIKFDDEDGDDIFS
jgi:predicted metallopeptidase